MRIQHNIAALNSHRQLTNNNSSVAKNLEKLSSGYRINRAGDDAAGLAISEKMRAQITGLNTASKNAQDGISLVQTAEGALTEVHSMLNRMTELAGQAANGTYQNEVDRENAMKELDSLRSEINRISAGTNFNGIKLLDGSLSGGSASAPVITAEWGTTPAMTEVSATAATYTDAAVTKVTAGKAKYNVEYTTADGKSVTTSVEFTATDVAKADGEAAAKAINEDSTLSSLFTAKSDATGKVTLTAKEKGSNSAVVTKMGTTSAAAVTVKGKDAGITFGTAMAAGDSLTVDGKTYSITGGTTDAENGKFLDEAALVAQLKADGYKVVDNAGADAATLAASTITRDPKSTSGKGLSLQIGDTHETFNQLTVSVKDMSTTSLDIAGINIKTQDGAKAAIEKIKTAINTVSSTRGDLGAIQNRLEHTINNLGVTAENMTAAESRIRDVDMAQEMMNFTKNNILTQASQSMLAQANQLPQGVLQLLQ